MDAALCKEDCSMATVGRYFELVVLFWLVPLYVIVRGFYTGYTDGFVTRSFGKVWGFIWALVLAVIIAHHASAEVKVTPCDRLYSFFTLWLVSFTSIHGCGVYLVKRYALSEKIHSWLEGHEGYARWRRSDQVFGGIVEALVLLGLAFFIAINIMTSFNQHVDAIPHYSPLNFAGYILYYPIRYLPDISSALNLTGPGAFGVEGVLRQFAPGSSDPLRHCSAVVQISQAPYAWTGYIVIFISAPLALVICFQPFLYSPLWLSDLHRDGFGAIRWRGSCKVCAGRGIHVRNLLLFGTPCTKCHGSGVSQERIKTSGVPDFGEQLAGHSDRPNLKLVIRSYVIFCISMFILAVMILMVELISGITGGASGSASQSAGEVPNSAQGMLTVTPNHDYILAVGSPYPIARVAGADVGD